MQSNEASSGKRVIMVGTSCDAMGGISSVVNVYKSAGVFERLNVHYIASHCDGNAVAKLGTLTRALLEFWMLLVCRKVGLVHIHVSLRASFWRKAIFFVSAFIFKVPTIFHLHSSQFPKFYRDECGSFRRALVRYIFNRVDRIVVLSSFWKDWVSSSFENRNIVLINNPVSLPKAVPPWESRVAQRLLFLGRLGKHKGTFDLISAAALASKRNKSLDIEIKMGGDGELEAVRTFCGDAGIADRVELLGWVRAEQRTQLLATAGVYALPSYGEGLPMSVLEAMAAGLPILSTPVGGIPELVTDGVEGFLLPAGDVAALASRLEQLLTEPNLAKTMGAAARAKIASTYSAEIIIPQLELLYAEFGVLTVPTK